MSFWDHLFEWVFSLCHPIPSWKKCTKASCWRGPNAAKRHMNMLSPHMPKSRFREYLDWQKDRGCNTIHAFLCNQGDGEYAGYSPFGAVGAWTGNVSHGTCRMFRERIREIRSKGLAFVPWILADDSPAFCKRSVEDHARLFRICAEEGLFAQASMVVLGLELDEYMSLAGVGARILELRKATRLKIGVHQTTGRMDYAPTADVFFGQIKPGSSHNHIIDSVHRFLLSGRPVCMFEMERNEDRDRSNVAFAAGAFSVGNW